MALSRGFVGGLLLAAVGSAVACGSSDDGSKGGSGTGGTSTTGGSSGSDGTATGGTSGKGGSSNTSGGTTSSGGSGDATGGSSGSSGKGGSSGSSGTGGSSGSSGNCTVPACLADLTADCTPTGACVEQQSDATDFSMPFTDAICYDNGVAALVSLDFATGNLVVTVSKNGDTCFSEEAVVDTSSGTASDLTVKDASGKTVATVSNDADGNSVISCGGKTYTVDASCDSTMAGMMGGTTDSCTMGTCTP